METAWRFRIMLIMAFAVIIFGDFLGYGNAKLDKGGRKNPSALRENPPHLDFNTDEGTMASDLENIDNNRVDSTRTKKSTIKTSPIKLSEALRESCLPKLLCEMAARPDHSLNDREKNLLGLIKSTTMSLSMSVTPTKWHFAAHMGQLLRNSGDSIGSASGCAQLWPNCPYSTTKLMQMSGRVSLK